MPLSWRKIEDENGFPYYINELNNAKQWDHPKFSDIQAKLDDCNWIKYSMYRVASKFRVLQHCLYMEDVSLSVIAGVFERHRLGSNEGSLFLETYDVEAVLSDIYFAANKQNQISTDIDLATEMMQNFLYNVYDKNRKNNVQVLSTKLVLAVLSNTKLNDLYHFIFNLCADHNNCVTRLKVQTILLKLSEITTYLHEDSSFGHHLVNNSIEDCFSKSPGLVGINESMFVNWLETNPQLLAWIPTMHRFKSAETVVHTAKCSVCKVTPIIGLKYRCMKCGRYIQCQKCYLTARISHSHKITHPMREYYAEGSSHEMTHTVVKKLCALLMCSAQTSDSHVIETKLLSIDKDWLLKSSPSQNVICDIEPMSSPHIQLQVVIRHLEQQNRELQQMLLLGNQNDKDMKRYLEEHRLHVAAQINKLKILKDYLKKPSSAILCQKLTMESTPMIPTYKNRYKGIDMLSPIVQMTEFSAPDDCDGLIATRSRKMVNDCDSTIVPTLNDISTWLGGKPNASTNNTHLGHKSPVREMHNDLDEALAKLQQILANNFTLDESLGNIDNGQLKDAVTEVEGMLTSLIDTVENSRASSAQPALLHKNQETDLVENRYNKYA